MDSETEKLTPVSPPRQWLGLLTLGTIGGLLLGVLLTNWSNRGGGDDDQINPPAVLTVAEAAAKVLPETGRGYAEAFRAAAVQVTAGEISDDRELLEFLQPRTLSARDAAKRDFDAAMERELPNGSIDQPAEVAELLEQVAEAFEN